jgi:hypothetical protein
MPINMAPTISAVMLARLMMNLVKQSARNSLTPISFGREFNTNNVLSIKQGWHSDSRFFIQFGWNADICEIQVTNVGDRLWIQQSLFGNARVNVAVARMVGSYALPLVTSNPDGVSNERMGAFCPFRPTLANSWLSWAGWLVT